MHTWKAVMFSSTSAEEAQRLLVICSHVAYDLCWLESRWEAETSKMAGDRRGQSPHVPRQNPNRGCVCASLPEAGGVARGHRDSLCRWRGDWEPLITAHVPTSSPSLITAHAAHTRKVCHTHVQEPALLYCIIRTSGGADIQRKGFKSFWKS